MASKGDACAYESPGGHMVVGLKMGNRIMIADPLMETGNFFISSVEEYLTTSRVSYIISKDLEKNAPEGAIGKVFLLRLPMKSEVPAALRKPMMHNEHSRPEVEKWIAGFLKIKAKSGYDFFHQLCPTGAFSTGTYVLDSVFSSTGYSYLDTHAILSIQSKVHGR